MPGPTGARSLLPLGHGDRDGLGVTWVWRSTGIGRRGTPNKHNDKQLRQPAFDHTTVYHEEYRSNTRFLSFGCISRMCCESMSDKAGLRQG